MTVMNDATGQSTDRTYSADELSSLSGTPRRTIRYYIQLGLVDRPEGETRAAFYTWQHLNQLLRIRELTEQGVSLDRIAQRLKTPETLASASAPVSPGSISVRSHLQIAAGVSVEIDPALASLTPEQLRAFARDILAAYQRAVKKN
jgi:DNA-binding transcriptional MerR regulator